MLELILMKKSEIGKSIVNVLITGKLISSGNISDIYDIMIMPADNINAYRTERHEYIYHGVDENHLGF